MFDHEPFVSMEYETTVSARGFAPANAVVEHIGSSDCRFRTMVLFDVGEIVEFRFGAGGHLEIVVRGTIVTRVSSGSRFVYVMHLDRMSAKELDALSVAVDAFEPVDPEPAPPEEPLADGLTRLAVRVPANFEITFRTPSLDFQPAKAIDISTGGLLMSCTQMLVPGVPVEVRLPLPDRRSDQALTLGARVVTRQEPIKGTFLYGLALTCVDAQERARLERYVNAARD